MSAGDKTCDYYKHFSTMQYVFVFLFPSTCLVFGYDKNKCLIKYGYHECVVLGRISLSLSLMFGVNYLGFSSPFGFTRFFSLSLSFLLSKKREKARSVGVLAPRFDHFFFLFLTFSHFSPFNRFLPVIEFEVVCVCMCLEVTSSTWRRRKSIFQK